MKSNLRINLRERERKDGLKSLFLDIFYEGKRVNEYLDLYLVPEVDKATRKANEVAMRKAVTIRSERLLHPETISFNNRARRHRNSNSAFPDIHTLDQWLDQYESLMRERGVSEAIMTIVVRVNHIIRMYLEHIKRPRLLMDRIDTKFVRGFLSWLRKDYKSGRSTRNVCGLSAGSLQLYQMRLNCVLNRAVREGVLEKNPFYNLGQQERYKVTVNHRESLTKDELERFLAVKTDGKAVQQAFGFASFTGLRIGDIQTLKWANVWTEGDSKMLSITMRKTQERIVIPLGKMALRYMPKKPVGARQGDLVFHLPTHTAVMLSCKWIARKAGITKNVSFHTSRHTFATLTLSACNDIKTVSKLLGHRSVLTTQRYADVNMKSKAEAVNHVDERFG